jgi:transcriptional regulator with XRE-family HTH domain
MATVGEIVKRRREAMRLNQRDLAAMAGVSHSFIFRLEAGYGRDWPALKLEAVARAIGYADGSALLREARENGWTRNIQPTLAGSAA